MPIHCQIIIKSIITLFISVFLSWLFNKLLIKIQNKRKTYQPIRDELKIIHFNKESTPTLGGVAIFLSITLTLVIINFNIFINIQFLKTYLIVSGFFLVGLVDDLIKLITKDYHGEKGIIRLVLEILLSFLLLKNLRFDSLQNQYINIFSNVFYIGLFAIIVFSFIVVGSANSMNLSDGLDGLATCLFIIAIMPFVIYAFKNEYFDIGFWLIASFGASIGFVIWNMHPSKIFMGDGGALYLGGLIGSVSVVFHLESILIITGAVLIVETLSVIIQVIYFKLTHRRIFLMAPLHHHFELKGFSEEKVVLVFMVIGYFFSLIAVILIL